MHPHPRPSRVWTTEDLVTAVAACLLGAVLLAGLLVWTAGQLAGRTTNGRWPQVPFAEAGRVALALPGHLADPASSWPPTARDQLAGPVVFYVVLAVLVIVVLAGLLGAAAVVVRPRRTPDARAERDRSSAWATRRQVPHLIVRRPESGRILLGRLGPRGPLIAAEARRSVLVVAPTQAGKTSRLVVPGVLVGTGRWS